MSDHAPNFTARVRITYRVQGGLHRSVSRLARGSTIEDASTLVSGLDIAIANMNPHIYADWEFIDASWAPEDQDTFDPLGTGFVTVVGGQATTIRTNSAKAVQMTLPYTGPGGQHGFFNLYGSAFFPGLDLGADDFRVTGLEEPDVASYADAMNALPIVGGAGNGVVFKQYVNVHFNRKAERRVRNG